jgi:hypothetical protein
MLHSVLTNDILSKKEDNFLPIETIRKLENGLIFNKLEFKGKSERRKFYIQLDLRRIEWVSGRELEGSINLRDIKEVRIAKNFKTFENKWSEDTKKCSVDQFFAIFYGKIFRLKVLTCFGESIIQI